MKIARGMFRLWILLSAVWLILVAAVSFESITNPYLSTRSYILPDQTLKPYLSDSPYVAFDIQKSHTEMEFPNEVKVYAHPSISVDSLSAWAREFAREYVQPREKERAQKRWEIFFTAVGWAAGVPVMLLIFGLALRWVFAGFRSSS
jgi:hypothetical protein